MVLWWLSIPIFLQKKKEYIRLPAHIDIWSNLHFCNMYVQERGHFFLSLQGRTVMLLKIFEKLIPSNGLK